MSGSHDEPRGERADEPQGAPDLSARELPSWWDPSLGDVEGFAGFDADDPAGMAHHVAEVFSRPVGPWLLTGLMDLDASALSADDAVSLLQHVQRASAWLAGVESLVRRHVVDRVTAHFDAERAVDESGCESDSARRFVSSEDRAVAELAAACRQSPRTGDARIQESVDLAGPWRPMLDAMLAGEIGVDHVRAIGRELRRAPGYGDASRAEAYARGCAKALAIVVPFAKTHSPGQSARKMALLVVASDPKAARERRRQVAESEHTVFITPTDDSGTCQLTAIMPTAHGHALMDAVNALAASPHFEVSDACVTKGQRRVAALATLVLSDPGSVAQVTGPVAEAKAGAHVNVLVPLATLLGTGEQGGRINAVPVTADVLRDVIAECGAGSTIRRLVTDERGVILDAGRAHYLASDVQKLVIRLRDGFCRAVGCDAPAWRPDIEIDHATDYRKGGKTDRVNLGPLCKHHHQLKTFGGWFLEWSSPNGDCTWRSPLGRIYEHTAPDLVPPPPEPDPDPPPF